MVARIEHCCSANKAVDVLYCSEHYWFDPNRWAARTHVHTCPGVFTTTKRPAGAETAHICIWTRCIVRNPQRVNRNFLISLLQVPWDMLLGGDHEAVAQHLRQCLVAQLQQLSQDPFAEAGPQTCRPLMYWNSWGKGAGLLQATFGPQQVDSRHTLHAFDWVFDVDGDVDVDVHVDVEVEVDVGSAVAVTLVVGVLVFAPFVVVATDVVVAVGRVVVVVVLVAVVALLGVFVVLVGCVAVSAVCWWLRGSCGCRTGGGFSSHLTALRRANVTASLSSTASEFLYSASRSLSSWAQRGLAPSKRTHHSHR